VQSRAIGELVMDELRQLDEVAYVRFASVYRHFEDVEAFHEEIQRLRSQRTLAPTGREARRTPKREPGRDANRDQLPLLPMDSQGKSGGPNAVPQPADTADAPKGPAAADLDDPDTVSGRTVATETK
jgi:hypothetical protein